MKKVFKTVFLICLIGISLLCLTCSKQYRNKYVTYEGHVLDTLGHLASGVSITLKACGGRTGDKQVSCIDIGSAVTDAGGHFYIHQRAARSDNYFVSFISNGKTWGWNPSGVSASTLSSSNMTTIHLPK